MPDKEMPKHEIDVRSGREPVELDPDLVRELIGLVDRIRGHEPH